MKNLKSFNLKSMFLTVLGSFITAMGVSLFYIPAKIVSGGVSGLATVAFHTFGIAPGLVYGVINAALLALALIVLGRGFVFKTLLGAAGISVFVQLLSYLPPVTSDPFLATVFGSVLYGVGIGIAFLSGASTGGTDIAARLIQHFIPSISIGKLLMVVDGVVILASLLAFGEIDLALFGIMALFISTYAVDMLISKMNVSKLAFVITSKGEEMARFLVSTSPRGVTRIDATGVYTEKSNQVLLCALKNSEIPEFQRKVKEFDPAVFIIYSEAQQIVGNGFHLYR